MTKVFIGGSRKLTKLPSLVTERLANIMQNGFQVLVGDANGADKAVQAYFAFQDYRQVAVFHTDKICRNNLGNWKTTSILAPAGKLTFKAYTLKDEAMAQAANYGFMLWDAKSKGTLNNLINLLKEDKKALVYLSAAPAIYRLHNFADLKALLTKCNQLDLEKFSHELPLAKFGLATSYNETLFAT